MTSGTPGGVTKTKLGIFRLCQMAQIVPELCQSVPEWRKMCQKVKKIAKIIFSSKKKWFAEKIFWLCQTAQNVPNLAQSVPKTQKLAKMNIYLY